MIGRGPPNWVRACPSPSRGIVCSPVRCQCQRSRGQARMLKG